MKQLLALALCFLSCAVSFAADGDFLVSSELHVRAETRVGAFSDLIGGKVSIDQYEPELERARMILQLSYSDSQGTRTEEWELRANFTWVWNGDFLLHTRPASGFPYTAEVVGGGLSSDNRPIFRLSLHPRPGPGSATLWGYTPEGVPNHLSPF